MKTSVKLLKELAKRKTELFKIDNYLFKEQLAFVKDPAPFKIAVTTRRAGKTTSCAADLIANALQTPDCVCLYITTSRSNAKRLAWPELQRMDRKFKFGITFNESELKAQFPNGSIIYCSGASDRTEIEKFRGLAVKIVYIDECQSFPSYIEQLINDVLAPSLLDHSGSLCLIGTPGPVPAGFFYDAATSDRWSHHFWTFWDNPFITEQGEGTHQERLERELNRRGVGVDDPTIQREWFGKWKTDDHSLVYRYKADKNHYTEIPNEPLTYILGIDIGYVDADALAVLGFSDQSKVTYLIEEVIKTKQGLTELVGQVEELRKKYDISKIVMDTGGLGKKISEEMIRRYKLPVEPAEKVRKNEYIELLNDAMATGAFKAKRDSRFAEDTYKIEWDEKKATPERKRISNRFHSDIADAVLYAWRCSYSFTYQKPPEKPAYGTEPYWKQEAEKMFEAELEKALELESMLKDPYDY